MDLCAEATLQWEDCIQSGALLSAEPHVQDGQGWSPELGVAAPSVFFAVRLPGSGQKETELVEFVRDRGFRRSSSENPRPVYDTLLSLCMTEFQETAGAGFADALASALEGLGEEEEA